MNSYHCSGLRIESELPLPLPVCRLPPGDPDLVVLLDGFELPEGNTQLPWDVGGAVYGMVTEGILIRAKREADFLVTGSSIRVRRSSATKEDLGDLVVRMALGFVLQSRAMLAFHGAAASRAGKAVAIFGERGAGKSTTVLALAKRGWGLLCDDIVVIEPGGNVPLGAAHVRLNDDSYDLLMEGLQADYAPLDMDGKHPVQPHTPASPGPLSMAFIIEAAEVDIVETRKIRGHEKLSAVLGHMHSPPGIGDPGDRLGRAAAVMSSVPLYGIRRPSRRFALEELLDTIEVLSL